MQHVFRTITKVIKKAHRDNRGVTFIELVVVISIFSIIAGTLLVNFSRFGRSITLQNLAQDIALQINDVQKEAISGRTNDFLASCDRLAEDCSPRYGIYLTSYGDGSNVNMMSYGGNAGRSLFKFIDYIGGFDNKLENGFNACGASANTECLDNISLGQGNYISEICGSSASNMSCDALITQGINIVFKRPFPDAIITGDDNTRYNYIRITITSPNADTPSKDIVVTKLGQISIEAHPQ